MKFNKLLISFCFVVFVSGFLSAFAQSLGKPKHIVIVIDTSLSVSQNETIASTRAIIKEVLVRKKESDIVTILTFNTRVLNRVDRSQENVEYLLKKVENYHPVGGWTFTALMLQKLVQEISKQENQSYAQSIFILSDGLDDPPTKRIVNLNKFLGKARVFYFRSLKEDTTQEELIRQVFPQISVKTIDTSNPLGIQQSLALLDDDFILQGVSLQLPLDFKLIADHKKESFIVHILANNNKLAGREVHFKVETDNPIFKQQTTKEKQNVSLQSSTERSIRLEEGDNSFIIPYFIPDEESGKIYNIVFSLALAQDPSNLLISKETKFNVVSLTFFETLYQLPTVYFVLLFIGLAILLFVLYRIIRYQLFSPLIELTYWYDYSYSSQESAEKTGKSKMEFSSLPSGRYVISAKPDAFLVLPHLSAYDELILIKKGSKFKTRVRIHSSSLRSLEGLGGGNIRKKRIRNGTAFKLGRYTLSFRTNV